MPLESASFIDGLVATNPTNTDSVRQGDDHIRLIKAVLKATFPNLNAAVNRTPADLNNGPVPIGGIIMWSGSVASIPTGWRLCDGTNGTPDLRGRFVIGAGDVGHPYQPGATGGNETVTLTSANLPAHTHGVGTLAVSSDGSHSHSHTFAVAGVSLTGFFDIARHNTSGDDFIRNATGVFSEGTSGSTSRKSQNDTSSDNMIRMSIDASHGHTLTGGISAGGSHTHSLSGSTASVGSGSAINIRPPFYALAYIMRVS